MKNLLAKILAPVIIALSFFAITAPTAHASSPYGCWYPASWGPVRVCYQIEGLGTVVLDFKGEVDNGWSVPITMPISIYGPRGRVFYANLYVPARSRRGWADSSVGYEPPGSYCAYIGAHPFRACYSVR